MRGTDVAGNIVGASIHLALTGSLPAPQSLMVSPPMVNMLVGDTQQFTAVDQLGRPRSDATWTVSDTTLATITTDSSPTLTAVAVGRVTLTASVGAVTAQAQVNILSGTTLPPGTIRWSAPSTSGFSVQQIVQAVPTQNGPDLYSIETDSNNTPLVRALTADGQQLWLAPFPQQAYNYGVFGTPNAVMPDATGGVIIRLLTNPGSFPQQFQVVDLDSQTGSQIWSLSPDLDFIPLSQEAAIRNDGTIFKFGTFQGVPALLGLDPNTGATVSAYSIPTGTATGTTCPNSKVPTVSTLSPPTVGSDGTVYSVLKKTDFVISGCFPGFSHPEVTLSSLTETLQLLQVAADGGTSLTLLRQDINTQTPTGGSFGGQVSIPLVPNQNFNSSALLLDYYQAIPQAQAFHVIPDGQGGTLAPYTFANVQNFVALPAYHQRIAHFSASALEADFPLPFQPTSNPQDFPMVLGENNTAFATDGSGAVAFDVSTGQATWAYSAPAQDIFSIISSSVGEALVGKITDQNLIDTTVRLDSNGIATYDGWTGEEIDYFIGNLWTGAASDPGTVAYSAPDPQEAAAPGTRPGGDPQHNGTTDPGFVLVATQDCHKASPASPPLYARYPIYELRTPADKTKPPQQNYTVFEFIPAKGNNCAVGGFSVLSPCAYADGSLQSPYNEFDDEISTGIVGGPFNNAQYFLYGLPKQRLFGVKQINRTLTDGTLSPKASWNQLSDIPHQDPLIDGHVDPWLAPWDGTPASCNSTGSQYFP